LFGKNLLDFVLCFFCLIAFEDFSLQDFIVHKIRNLLMINFYLWEELTKLLTDCRNDRLRKKNLGYRKAVKNLSVLVV